MVCVKDCPNPPHLKVYQTERVPLCALTVTTTPLSTSAKTLAGLA